MVTDIENRLRDMNIEAVALLEEYLLNEIVCGQGNTAIDVQEAIISLASSLIHTDSRV